MAGFVVGSWSALLPSRQAEMGGHRAVKVPMLEACSRHPDANAASVTFLAEVRNENRHSRAILRHRCQDALGTEFSLASENGLGSPEGTEAISWR